MKLQSPAQLLCFIILITGSMPFFARAQDTTRIHKTPSAKKSASYEPHFGNNDFFDSYDYWQNQRLHAGMGVSVGFMNAPGSIDAAIVFSLGVDVLKYKWYALSIEIKPQTSLVSSINFAEFPLLAEHNFSFGLTKYNEPAWGFYFGGGISYVVDSYLKTTGDANSANFWGYVFNGGIRISHFDIGFAKVTSLRGIDQIANPALYEIILGVRF